MEKSQEIANGLQAFQSKTLSPLGWVKSFQQKLPVDHDGHPLPWWTYSAIEFISTWVKPSFRVFEYGGGHSTLWWSRHVEKVITIDHDTVWVNKIRPRLTPPHEMRCIPLGSRLTNKRQPLSDLYFEQQPRNEFPYDDARITRRGLNDRDFIEYLDSINQYSEQFDCVVIDGMARRLCAYYAVPKLKTDGIIIFDNSNRSDYMEGYRYLVEQGFFQIRFWGSVAGATFPTCTSVFIRTINSLPKIDFQSSIFDVPEY